MPSSAPIGARTPLPEEKQGRNYDERENSIDGNRTRDSLVEAKHPNQLSYGGYGLR
jgi:hypothetical protein